MNIDNVGEVWGLGEPRSEEVRTLAYVQPPLEQLLPAHLVALSDAVRGLGLTESDFGLVLEVIKSMRGRIKQVHQQVCI